MVGGRISHVSLNGPGTGLPFLMLLAKGSFGGGDSLLVQVRGLGENGLWGSVDGRGRGALELEGLNLLVVLLSHVIVLKHRAKFADESGDVWECLDMAPAEIWNAVSGDGGGRSPL